MSTSEMAQTEEKVMVPAPKPSLCPLCHVREPENGLKVCYVCLGMEAAPETVAPLPPVEMDIPGSSDTSVISEGSDVLVIPPAPASPANMEPRKPRRCVRFRGPWTDRKKCSKCPSVKTLEEFGKAPHGYLGRKSVCKECERNRYKKSRREGNNKMKGPGEKMKVTPKPNEKQLAPASVPLGAPAGDIQPQPAGILLLDLSDFPELHARILEIARNEERSPASQVRWWLKQTLLGAVESCPLNSLRLLDWITVPLPGARGCRELPAE
jgi:hypothetical protein